MCAGSLSGFPNSCTKHNDLLFVIFDEHLNVHYRRIRQSDVAPLCKQNVNEFDQAILNWTSTEHASKEQTEKENNCEKHLIECYDV